MVAVCILNQLQNIPVKLIDERALLVRGNEFYGLDDGSTNASGENARERGTNFLNHTTPIHVQGECENITLHRRHKLGLLRGSTKFEQFLNDLDIQLLANICKAEVRNNAYIVTEDILN